MELVVDNNKGLVIDKDNFSAYDFYVMFDSFNGKVVLIHKEEGWTLTTIDNNFNFEWHSEILPLFKEDESFQNFLMGEIMDILRDCGWIGHVKAFTLDSLINWLPSREHLGDDVADYYVRFAVVSDDDFSIKQVSVVPNVKNAWVVCDIDANGEVLSDTAVFVRDLNSLEEAIIGLNDRNKVMVINYTYCVYDDCFI